MSEFSQVLINLLNNSKDAFNQNSSDDRIINLEIKKIDNNYAMISFKDSAGGIEKDVIDKVFEPILYNQACEYGYGIRLIYE